MTINTLAGRAGLHPEIVERYIDFGLIEPVPSGERARLFEASAIVRLRKIERLRHDLGINLAGIAVVLDLLDRLCALERENERLRFR